MKFGEMNGEIGQRHEYKFPSGNFNCRIHQQVRYVHFIIMVFCNMILCSSVTTSFT